jgi:hypothetical protein
MFLILQVQNLTAIDCKQRWNFDLLLVFQLQQTMKRTFNIGIENVTTDSVHSFSF